ncbi:MAG: helix-turn-helix domain-containing protein [Bacteroidota bacterium]
MKKVKHQGQILEAFLKENGCNVSQIASKLNMSRTTFYRKLKQVSLSSNFIDMVSQLTGYHLLPKLLETGETCISLNPKKEADIMHKYIFALERQLSLLQMSTSMLFKEVERCKAKKKEVERCKAKKKEVADWINSTTSSEKDGPYQTYLLILL